MSTTQQLEPLLVDYVDTRLAARTQLLDSAPWMGKDVTSQTIRAIATLAGCEVVSKP